MAAAEVQGPAQGPAMVVSISGLRDSTLLDVARFVAAMEQRGISPSLLIAPYSGKDWSLRQAPAVLDWVRRRCDDGMEVVLAGFDQSVRGRSAEFSALSPHEARLRLTAATRQMKMLGLHTDIFAPPKWQMSPGTLEVLPELGFRIAADRNSVVDLATGAVDPTRVLALGEGFGGARWWRQAVRASVARSIAKNRPVRLSVAATRLREHKLRRDMFDVIDEALVAGAQPSSYSQVPLGFSGVASVTQLRDAS